MQATVAAYHEQEHHGQVVLDDGRRMPFGPEALSGTGIRLLRPGQRVGIEAANGLVHRLWLPGTAPTPE